MCEVSSGKEKCMSRGETSVVCLAINLISSECALYVL